VALRVVGEQEFAVPPLPLPDLRGPLQFDELMQCEAVRLFVERAVEVRPDFAITADNGPAVAAICHRLDGLPLALELGAVRVRSLTPSALLARLERALPLLTTGRRDAPPRQQTLRATIAWSHELLKPNEQALFRRLGVFVGGWTLELPRRSVAMRGTWTWYSTRSIRSSRRASLNTRRATRPGSRCSRPSASSRWSSSR
jgi:predicted ATPase